ncbi:TIGR03084 family metal-binding protein [Nocardioides sp. CER19]|uniref:TIGR03084 family metal-binding protein n=1 Tax=Nocardioides sp. CER19 TaxID=3038538 RepID=UPI00244734F8|nr:TIGR03084 family metal-binding protein [Nocardioides sp. CER19]MDH2412682.1 TIGR03084 family metal-binding protein [Nocardioides sp. CER19]
MTMLDDLLGDLAAESDRLRAAVAPLDDAGWHTPTPAEGWDVATQIAHLTWTDEAAVLAARAAAGDKADWDAVVLAALEDPDGFVDKAAAEAAQALPEDLLARWDASRGALAEALRGADGKMPWFGPPMSPSSMATARFMETWAHGLDVVEALAEHGLGTVPEPTDRIRHVCHLGIRTRDWVFGNHGLARPAAEFRLDLVAPSGGVWSWGPEEATQSVTGPAYDFARLVTQRIHRADTELVAVGEDADRWLDIAQAFAGPPGPGRERR